MGGFFMWPTPLPTTFAKAALSIPDQLKQLIDRGMIVNDPAEAAHYLKHIGYFRFSGYALPFQKGGTGVDRHAYQPGTEFQKILDLYVFDRKLRLVVMDAIERIEISVRSTLTNLIALRHGPHWYQDPALFSFDFDHAAFIDDIKRQIGHDPSQDRRRDIYIRHYYNAYGVPDMPPCWMIFETITFGSISMAFKKLVYAENKPICDAYGFKYNILSSWLHSISYIRNICAHHARLWNRISTIKPLEAKEYKKDLDPNDRVYAQLVVIQILLAKIVPGNHWANKLSELLTEHPAIPLPSMGFPSDWRTRRVWGF